MGTFIGTLSSVDVVGFLVKDVVDSINQKIEGEGHPNQNGQDFPGPEVARQPHPHDRGSNGVDPEDRSRDLNKPLQHPPSLSAIKKFTYVQSEAIAFTLVRSNNWHIRSALSTNVKV